MVGAIVGANVLDHGTSKIACAGIGQGAMSPRMAQIVMDDGEDRGTARAGDA